jgi:WD40 repeat protein
VPAGFALAFHPYRNLAAIGAIDGSVSIHDSENPGVPLHVLSIKKAKSVGSTCSTAGSDRAPQVELPVSSISFHPILPDILVATTNDGNVRVWNFAKEEVVCRHWIESPGFTTATFSGTGQSIAITSEDGPLVWKPETGKVITLRGHRRSTWMVDFRPGNGVPGENTLVSSSSDSTRVWRMQAALEPMPLSQGDLDRVRWSTLIADKQLQIYNGVRQEHVKFEVPPQSVAAAASADGTHVLVARRNTDPRVPSLMLYNSDLSSEAIAAFEAPIADWSRVGFLTNPDRVVAVSASGAAYSWLYFRTPELLTEFARKHLPRQEGQTVELPEGDQCRFGIRLLSTCQGVFAAQDATRRGVF